MGKTEKGREQRGRGEGWERLGLLLGGKMDGPRQAIAVICASDPMGTHSRSGLTTRRKSSEGAGSRS